MDIASALDEATPEDMMAQLRAIANDHNVTLREVIARANAMA
jgi:hypothetical protein